MGPHLSDWQFQISHYFLTPEWELIGRRYSEMHMRMTIDFKSIKPNPPADARGKRLRGHPFSWNTGNTGRRKFWNHHAGKGRRTVAEPVSYLLGSESEGRGSIAGRSSHEVSILQPSAELCPATRKIEAFDILLTAFRLGRPRLRFAAESEFCSQHFISWSA